MDIKYFNEISKKYGKFEFENLLMLNSRLFSLIEFDSNYNFRSLDGFFDENLIKLIKENSGNLINIWAGYKSLKVFLIDEKNIDVFIIRKELILESDIELKELLVFHEICHFLEQTKYYEYLKINLHEDDFKVGDLIEEIANDVAIGSNDFYHNRDFGALLNYFFKNYSNSSRHILLGKSMVKNFMYDYSEKFK